MSRIIAIGGGGFVGEHDARMHRYVLAQAAGPRPKICFVPTGKGDDPGVIERFYAAFGRYACEPSHLGLFSRKVRDLESFVMDQDIVFVWGGNTASMLAVWHAHGLDEVLRKATARGVVLAGACAGALAWFQDGVTDSFGGLDRLGGGLGLLEGTLCPYYDADPERRPLYQRLVGSRELASGYAIDVDVALRFQDAQLVEVVASREGPGAWEVHREDGSVRETRLAPTPLEGRK